MTTLNDLETERAKILRAMKRTKNKGYYMDLSIDLDNINERIAERYLC